MFRLLTASVGAALLLGVQALHAAPVNGTGLVTPDVVFGDGVANADWTGVTVGTLELALRAKLRYNANGRPENVQNYDGDRTYRFDRTGSNIPANRAVFNFDYSINTDVADTSDSPTNVISDYIFEVLADYDPSGADTATNLRNFIFDDTYGFNSTPNGDGVVNPLLASSRNVAQNSRNLGFGLLPGNPALGDGKFTFTLSAFERSNGGKGALLGSTSIDVIVGQPAPVPLPAALPLMLVGLGGFAALRRRKRA